MYYVCTRFVLAVFGVLMLVLAGCATTAPASHRVHYSLLDTVARPVPTKVALLPLDIKVSEVFAGGVVEEVPEWTEQGVHHIRHGIEVYAGTNPQLQILPIPRLTGNEQKLVKEHLALYNIVAGGAFQTTTFGGSGWKHKVDHFDYTLGTGLAFLKSRTGADAGLVVVGRHQVATKGRVAAAVLAALFGGGYMQASNNFLTIGIVDFETGDILWFNYTRGATGRDLRKVETADEEVRRLLEEFPGLEIYRKRR
ncbi:MAG: hypothetical protein ACE5NW_13600 [Acidiferrobacterales bacterium]